MTDNYTPEIYENTHVLYVKMIVEAKKCHLCRKIMLPKINRGLFPNYVHMNQDAQMKRAGFVYGTSTEVDGMCICINCKDLGKVDILCSLCNERKPSNKVQESFGSPPEYLCTDCYEITPAKKWQEKFNKLEDSHKYDFE